MYTKVIESFYGAKILHVFRTAEGRIVKWWATGATPDSWVKGAVVSIRGTVKSQEEYQGRKETTLTRCTEWDGKVKGSKGTKRSDKEQ